MLLRYAAEHGYTVQEVYIDEDYSEAEAKSVGSRINLISNVH